MSGFAILDLILGLVFIFFVLSILSSTVVEVIMTKRNIRSIVLTEWLLRIFDKKIMQPDNKPIRLGQAIMDHCLTTALAPKGEANSFMDAKNFVSALIEKLSYDPSKPGEVVRNLDQLLEVIRTAKATDGSPLLSTELQRTLLLFGNEAIILAPSSIANQGNQGVKTTLPDGTLPADVKNSFQIFREKMENWFDSSMDRIGGSMKKKYTRPLTFWIGLLTTVALNADTIQISQYLYDNKEQAKALADKAAASAQSIQTNMDSALRSTNQEALKKISASLDTLNLAIGSEFPLGWKGQVWSLPDVGKAVGSHAIGWLATVIAIMLGAPFWFDMLNKISNVRSAGSKPVSSTDQQRKDLKG